MVHGSTVFNLVKAPSLRVRRDIRNSSQKHSQADHIDGSMIPQIPNLQLPTEVYSHPLSLSLRRSRAKDWTAASHSFPKFLSLLRTHLFPTFHHSTPPSHRQTVTAAESAEKDFRQHQKTQSLPEADAMQCKESRHQPVPQTHHHNTQHCRNDQNKQREFEPAKYPSSLHLFDLTLIEILYGCLRDAPADRPLPGVYAKQVCLHSHRSRVRAPESCGPRSRVR